MGKTIDTLILVPTQVELDGIAPRLAEAGVDSKTVQLCGFGPITAAAGCARLVTKIQPQRVMLIGIAGGYRAETLGSALRFGSVGCYGVGIGSGDSFRTSVEIGWPQVENSSNDVIPLRDQQHGMLLTCCSAAAGSVDVDLRLKRFPTAEAEDMEGFGVALACQHDQVPLTIVRGISNIAGQRDHSEWQIPTALEAAAALAIEDL